MFDGERVLDRRDVLVSNGVIGQVSATRLTVPSRRDGRRRNRPNAASRPDRLTRSSLRQRRRRLASGALARRDDRARHVERRAALRGIKALRVRRRARRRRVRTAGIGATVAGGHPSQMGGRHFPTITDPADAQSVRERAHRRRLGLHQDHLRRSRRARATDSDDGPPNAERVDQRGAQTRQARRRARRHGSAGARRRSRRARTGWRISSRLPRSEATSPTSSRAMARSSSRRSRSCTACVVSRVARGHRRFAAAGHSSGRSTVRR